MGSKTERVSLVKTSGIFFLHVLRKIKQTNGFLIVNYIVKHFLLLIVLLDLHIVVKWYESYFILRYAKLMYTFLL